MRAHILASILIAGSLAGCGHDPQTGKPTFDATVKLWGSPEMKAAIGNVTVIQQAFDCGVVVPTAALANKVVADIGAKKSAVDTAGKVYAVSADLCDFAKTLAANAK